MTQAKDLRQLVRIEAQTKRLSRFNEVPEPARERHPLRVTHPLPRAVFDNRRKEIQRPGRRRSIAMQRLPCPVHPALLIGQFRHRHLTHTGHTIASSGSERAVFNLFNACSTVHTSSA